MVRLVLPARRLLPMHRGRRRRRHVRYCSLWRVGDRRVGRRVRAASVHALARFVGLIEQLHPEPLYTIASPPGETKAELDAWTLPPADLFDVPAIVAANTVEQAADLNHVVGWWRRRLPLELDRRRCRTGRIDAGL